MSTKSAKIIESSGKSVESKSFPGLFDCILEHAVKETKAEFNWSGPRITPEMWLEVLAFFQWTQDTEKSESQVRLFVHPVHGWLAWAFPQKGGTSMTTKELDNEDAKKQRAENIPAGYVAFGTVHHHCNMSAFQSGTDTADEKAVDGLHITIGDLDKTVFSMHARLYIKGNKFEPNMSSFWNIGDEAWGKIEFVQDLGFEAMQLADKLARVQMCQSAPKEQLFNPLWKVNYVVEKYQHSSHYEWSANGIHQNTSRGMAHIPRHVRRGNGKKDNKESQIPAENSQPAVASIASVMDDVETMAEMNYTTYEELYRILKFMGDDVERKMIQGISDLCHESEFTIEDLWEEMETRVKEAIIAESKGSQPTQEEIAEQVTSMGYEGGMGYGQ